MKKILLAGATGVLGTEILKLLQPTDYWVRALVRRADQQEIVRPYCEEVFVGDATDPSALHGACQDIDIVLTTIGKSVSLFTNSAASFLDIDYQANLNLLSEARGAGVNRFVYVSIFGSETSPKLRVGWSQELFTRQLMQSGLSHTIIKPVGFFSGLHDLVIMANKGVLIIPGDGESLTNAIHQGDLAGVCVQCLEAGPPVMEVGGPEIHSRNEVAQLVADHTGARKLNVPVWLVLLGLRVLRPFSKNLYDKLSYFTYITTNDMVAPPYGERTFADYLKTELPKSLA
jgi:uncharacterized protein YbjT (DUF2867 family)